MQAIALTLWYAPALLMTLWTLLAVVTGFLAPIRREVNIFAAGHVLLMMRNPKDKVLYNRPSPIDAMFCLLAGLVPGVGLFMLVVHVAYHCLLAYVKAKAHRSRYSRDGHEVQVIDLFARKAIR